MTEPPPLVLEQVRDAVLAAEEDDLQVDVLHALPGLERRVEHRGVVVGRDAGVVEQHVDAAELARARAAYIVGDRVLVGDVDGEREIARRALGRSTPTTVAPSALEARRPSPRRSRRRRR